MRSITSGTWFAGALAVLAMGATAVQAASLLPARHYGTEASFAGRTLHEKATLKPGRPAKAVFLWPAGTGESKS